MIFRQLILVLVLGCVAPFSAHAQVGNLIASIDRSLIRVNESFTYTLTAEGRLAGRPDFSALTRDFDLVRTGSSTSVQIVNGQANQVAIWNIELMPREIGEFVLPPVELGGLLSNAVALEILPPAPIDAASADIFVETEIDRIEAYVQSQVIFTLRVYVDLGIQTGREALSGLLVTGGEAIVERLGNDREFQIVRGERVYRVRERKFAIFPQTAGELSIGPVEYEASVVPRIGFSRVQSLRSDSVRISVLPAVGPPSSHPTAVWLPARDLRIEEVWRDGTVFEQGVPKTRQLTVIAAGLLETQLPELELTEAEGLRQYSDQPELSSEVTSNGIEARRIERFAVIAQRPGMIEFPPVELPWWNVDENRWEIARIEPTTVDILAAADSMPDLEAPPTQAPQTSLETADTFWPILSTVLAVGWLATIAAWVFSARIGRKPSVRRSQAKPVSARTLNKQLTAACRVDDAQRSRDLLLEWAARQFADDPPSNLGGLADRLSGPLADEVRLLESTLYGRESRTWQGRRLAELIKSVQSVTPASDHGDQDPLRPLYR